jgi:hypothetical protein
VPVVRGIFYFEAVSNLGTAVYVLLFPAQFLAQLVPQDLPLVSVELGRWYAVLLLVLSAVLLGALREGDDRFLRRVIVAFLIGDGFQIAVSVRLGVVLDSFPFAVHAAIWSSVFYAAARVYYLRSSRSSAPR